MPCGLVQGRSAADRHGEALSILHPMRPESCRRLYIKVARGPLSLGLRCRAGATATAPAAQSVHAAVMLVVVVFFFYRWREGPGVRLAEARGWGCECGFHSWNRLLGGLGVPGTLVF